MSDDRIAVWPFNDPEFEGSAVSVIAARFAERYGESSFGCDVKQLARLAHTNTLSDANFTLLEMDCADAAERVWLERDQEFDKGHDVATGFMFGATFVLWRLEQAGFFDDAERRAWIRERQGAGGKKSTALWHRAAWLMALAQDRLSHGKSQAEIAGSVNARLAAKRAHLNPPTDARTVENFLSSMGFTRVRRGKMARRRRSFTTAS